MHFCTRLKCMNFKTLSEAKNECKLSYDCVGITKENDSYQLRAGPTIYKSKSGEKSWWHHRVIEQCNDKLGGDNGINVEMLENSYKELRGQRIRGPYGKCLYRGS